MLETTPCSHQGSVRLGEAPRILITRLSAIGDCIHTLPVLCALRDRYPRAFIGWATQTAPAKLIEGHGDLDQLIRLDRNWFRSLASIRQVRRELRQRRFEVAIDPQGLTKSAMIGWLSGAPCRIGFARGQARELSPWLNNVAVAPQTHHVIDKYLELLTPLGICPQGIRYGVPLDASADEAMSQFRQRAGLGRSFAVLNPGAGWDSKVWPHERYADVAQHLWRRQQLPSIVVWAGSRERHWASEVVTSADEGAVLARDTTLPELASLLRSARLFVGSDTGPLHLAVAVGTPCVSMYGPTRPAECGPYGEKHVALQAFYQSGSGKERRGHDNRAMRAIDTEMVCRACDQMLNRPLFGQGGRAVA